MGFQILQTFWEMVKIERKELKSDPVFKMLLEAIIKNHVTAEHTVKTLSDNKETDGFCEISIHFAKRPGLFLSYEAWSWLKENRVLVKIQSITVYDNEAEYLIERAKGMKDLSGFIEKN